MKAFVIDRYQPADGGHLADITDPTAAAGQVLVRVHAAGVNQLDAKIRNGEFKMILRFAMPLVLGNDVAGVVTAVGAGVERFRVGDEVYARTPGRRHRHVRRTDRPRRGCRRQQADHPVDGRRRLDPPRRADRLASPRRAGQAPARERVFIRAGSGGVGTIAIQLAKHLGATVATTTSAANAELVGELGADVVIDYRTQDFEAILADYDVVLHSQDAKQLEKSLRILKPGGRLISISGPPDPAFAREVHAPWFVRPVLAVTSAPVRRRAKRRNVDYQFLFMRAEGGQLSQLTSLIDAGTIRPVIDRTFPLEATLDAITHVESGRSRGKVVVTVG